MSKFTRAFIGLVMILTLANQAFAGSEPETIADKAWFKAEDVVAFQPFAQASPLVKYGQSEQLVQMTSLNTHSNAWFLLTIQSPQRQGLKTFNLENPFPLDQGVSLTNDGKIQLKSKGGIITVCDVLEKNGLSGAIFSALNKDPYMPLCEGRLYLRNMSNGRKDSISMATTALRGMFGEAGDNLVNAVKSQVYDGKFFAPGTENKAASAINIDEGGPLSAEINDDKALLANHGLDIEIKDAAPQGLRVGQWYKAKNFDGIFVSVMKAKYVPDAIMKSYSDRVRGLNNYGQGESEAVVDSVAIDLSLYRFGWNSGTEHPGVGWSIRAANPSGPGPDGFDNLKPLAFPGVVNPVQASQTIAVLTGGFQRLHSAFKFGPLSLINSGSHYGFMEKGVVMSTLVPNLSTVMIYQDGSLDIKTWKLADNKNLAKIRDARQNGVPLIETDEKTGKGIPSAYVGSWENGNWSGSASSELKSPRTSFCIAERGNHKYLIVSYFSTHTPNGMARVLQAYQCKYAIHMDMNHPRFAYTAFFRASADGDFKIEHLNKLMAEEVVKVNNKAAPRSLLTPTYKDFFYVTRKP